MISTKPLYNKAIILLCIIYVNLYVNNNIVHAVPQSIKDSMTRYVDKKVKDLSKYKQYVCNEIGRDPGDFDCWDKNGNQKSAGGKCQSPKNCLIYETPAFNMNNKVQSWSGSDTYQQLKNNLFKSWGLTKSALDEVEMATLMEKGKFVDIHVYTETNKGTGEYKFELATVETHPDGKVKHIGYINIQSKGWIIKPRACVSTKTKKGGFFGSGGGTKRKCNERGLRSDEIEKMRKTLELYAFKSVDPMIGGSNVKAPPCKREFNCYCYMERNKGKVPSGGNEECLNAYEHFMAHGKNQGLKGTCCASGASVSNPSNDATILFDGTSCEKGINWNYNQGKKEIKVWGGCKATFECNGDVVKCEAGNCPEADDDRRRRRRRRRLQESEDAITKNLHGRNLGYSSYMRCRDRCGVNSDDDRRRRRRRRLTSVDTSHHTMCKNKCGVSYDDDDGWDDMNSNQKTCVGSCVGCFEECVGCSKTCKCKDVKLRRRLSKNDDDDKEEEDDQIIDKKSHLTFSFPSLKRISHYNRNNPRILKNHQNNPLWSATSDESKIYESRGRRMIDRQQSIDNNKNKKRNLMRTGLIGPEWTRGMIEPPEGEKDMGGWVAAVYTEEQQLRLGINEKGEKLSVNLDEDSHEPQYATARHLSYKSEGYESLGQGYFKNNFDDYFYANGFKNTKQWMKLNSVFGRLNVLGAGYAQDSSGNAYFNGAKMKSIFGRLKVLTSERWREITNYAIDSSDTVVYKGRKVKSAFGGFHAYGNGWGKDGSDRHFLNGKKTSSGIPRNLLPNGDDDAFNMFENDEDVVDSMSNFDETYTFDY